MLEISETAAQLFGCAAFAIGVWAPAWLSQNTALITPIVILFSVGAAFFGVWTNRLLTRRRATLDLIERAESTKFYQDRYQLFRRHREQGTLTTLHLSNYDEQNREYDFVLDFLNHYELVALGIRQKILDEKFYKRWMRSVFIRDWDAATKFIEKERWVKIEDKWYYRRNFFEHFEHIAIKWGATARINKKPDPPVN